jgi:hypothetical protein
MTELLLFATTVESRSDVTKLAPLLHAHFGNRWHFDLGDDIALLRFVGKKTEVDTLCNTMNEAGYECLEIEAGIVVPMPAKEKTPLSVLNT